MDNKYREQISSNKDMLSGAKSHISNTSLQKLETPLPTIGGTINNNSHNPSVSHTNQNQNHKNTTNNINFNINNNNNNIIIVKSNVSKQNNQQLINATTKTPLQSSSTMTISATEVLNADEQNGLSTDNGKILSQEECRVFNLAESSSLIKIKQEQVEEPKSSNQSIEKTSQGETNLEKNDDLNDHIAHSTKQPQTNINESPSSPQQPTSPGVTVILPKHAASRLHELVQNQDLSLLKLGILSVQFENDQIINLPSNAQSWPTLTSSSSTSMAMTTSMSNHKTGSSRSEVMDLGGKNDVMAASDGQAPLLLLGESASTAIKRPREINNEYIAQSKSIIRIESPPQKLKRLDVFVPNLEDENNFSSSSSSKLNYCDANVETDFTNPKQPTKNIASSQVDLKPKGSIDSELIGKPIASSSRLSHDSIIEPSQQQTSATTTATTNQLASIKTTIETNNKEIMITKSNIKMKQKTALKAVGAHASEPQLNFKLINDQNKSDKMMLMDVDEILLVRHDQNESFEQQSDLMSGTQMEESTKISGGNNHQKQLEEPKTKHLSQQPQQPQEAIIMQQHQETLLDDDDDRETIYHDADEVNMIISKPAANIVVGDDGLIEPDYCAGLSMSNATKTVVNSGIIMTTGLQSRSKKKSNLVSNCTTSSSKMTNTMTKTKTKPIKQTKLTQPISQQASATKEIVTNNNNLQNASIPKQSTTTKGLNESISTMGNKNDNKNNNNLSSKQQDQIQVAQAKSSCNTNYPQQQYNCNPNGDGISVVRGDDATTTTTTTMLIVQDDVGDFIVDDDDCVANNDVAIVTSGTTITTNNNNHNTDDDYEEMDDKDENEVANEVENQHGSGGSGSGYNIHQLSQLDFTDPIDMENMYSDSDNILFPDYTLNLS